MRIVNLFMASLLIVTTASCSPSSDTQAPPQVTKSAASPSATPTTPLPSGLNSADIVGEWRIAGVNGKEINEPAGATAKIAASEILIQSDCVNMAYDYSLVAGRFTAKSKPVISCQRALSAAEKAIGDAITTADAASRDASNALILSGGGHSLTLYTQ